MKLAKTLAAATCAALVVMVFTTHLSKSSADSATRGRAVVHSIRHKELWVTHQRDSAISILKFPSGELLDGFSLPAGTQPHIITFHSGKYAYVSGMGNGALSIVDADSRQLLKTLNFAPALCHQGKVSPDGTIMLVSVLPTRKLHKLAVDESNGSWTPLSSVEFPVSGRRHSAPSSGQTASAPMYRR